MCLFLSEYAILKDNVPQDTKFGSIGFDILINAEWQQSVLDIWLDIYWKLHCWLAWLP